MRSIIATLCILFSAQSYSKNQFEFSNLKEVYAVYKSVGLNDMIGDTGTLYTTEFSPDGKYLLSAGSGASFVTELSTQKQTVVYSDGFDWVGNMIKSAHFSPDGKYVVTVANYSRAIIVTELSTLKIVAKLKYFEVNGGFFSRFDEARFSPDGKYVIAVLGNTVLAVELGHYSFSSDNSEGLKYEIVYMDDSENLKYKIVHNASTYSNTVNSVEFSPDGKYILTASNDNTARVSDTVTGKEVFTIKHNESVNRAEFSPDGKYILTASDDKTARVSDAVTGKEVLTLNNDRSVYTAKFSPNGKYIVTTTYTNDKVSPSKSFTGSIKIINLTTKKEMFTKKYSDASYIPVEFSPDGKYITVAPSITEPFEIIHVPTLKIVFSKKDIFFSTNKFSPDSKYFVMDIGGIVYKLSN